MPYDGTSGRINYELLGKIEQVIDLIGTPDKWCKGSEHNKAGQYCIRGALIAVGGLEELQPIVLRGIHQVAGRGFRRIEEFNDHLRTTHAQVLKVLHRARENIVTGEPESSLKGWWSVAAAWLRQKFGPLDDPPAKPSVIPPHFLRPEDEFLAGESEPAKTPELVG